MTQKSELGKLGEDLACGYLVGKGYKVIERNFRKPWGELDIIAKSPDKTLVFVEVKTVRQCGNKFGNLFSYPQLPNSEITLHQAQYNPEQNKGIEPEMQLTNAKLKKMKRTASLYVGDNPDLINEAKGWRLDLLALVIKDISELILGGENDSLFRGLTTDDKNFVIRHYENI